MHISTFSTVKKETTIPHFFKHFQQIETDRLIIRKLSMADVCDCFAITSDSRVLKMMVALPLHKTLKDTEEYLFQIVTNYEQDKNEWWAVVEKESNRVIGFCGFVEYKPHFRRVELGYMFAYDYWGKGYATEASKALIDYGFNMMNLNRIEATVDPENNASIKILEKLGMHYEGLMHKRVICNGEPRDRMVFGLLQKSQDISS